MENSPVMLLTREIPEHFPGITKNAARQLIINGDVPSVRIGKKYLVCKQVFEDFLVKGNNQAAQPEPMTSGKIRRLS